MNLLAINNPTVEIVGTVGNTVNRYDRIRTIAVIINSYARNASAGKFTELNDKKWKKDRKMLEDAVRQVELFDSYLLNKDNGLYWHGWDQQSGEVRGAHWGRCNGWMMFAMVTLMDYIKDNKALVDRVLPIFRNHVRNICRYQDSDGMWHQLIDDPQSYKESSCTAIYVYCIAHGIVNGWLDSSYASSALKGWDAICNGQISEGYELKNVCVGTGIGADKDFYRNRRKVDGEIHGTGLLIEAGMAMVRLGNFLNR